MFNKIIEDTKVLFPGLDKITVSKIKGYLEHDLGRQELSISELKKIAQDLLTMKSLDK